MGSNYGNSSESYTVIPVEIGLAGFISNNFAIEPTINFIQGQDKGGVMYNGVPTSARSSFGLNIAFMIYLNRHKKDK